MSQHKSSLLHNRLFLIAVYISFARLTSKDFEVIPTYSHEMGILFLDLHSKFCKNTRIGVSVMSNNTEHGVDSFRIEVGPNIPLAQDHSKWHWVQEDFATTDGNLSGKVWKAKVDNIINAIEIAFEKVGIYL